jgi:methionyl-tRNA synthetase
MSKSKGNVIYGDELVEKFGLDAVRYYLLSEMSFYNDGCITYELMVKRTNADLANTLGNLVSRTCAMVKQYFGGVIPAPVGEDAPAAVTLKQTVTEKLESAYRLMDRYSVAEAVEEIFVALRACNKYIDETTPWVLAKDESKKDELASVMANLVESIRLCNIMLTPFMPDACEKIDQIITATPAEICDGNFGYVYANTGHELGETPILFTRIDEKKFMDALLKEQAVKAKAAKEAEKAKKAAEAKKEEAPVGLIGIEDFAKVELTVGQVLTCEPVEKSDKLLKLTVDIGSEVRQVVSGIAKWYAPADLIGKKLVLVTNLKPVKLRGVESFGMILAADKGEAASVLFLDDSIPVGSKIH